MMRSAPEPTSSVYAPPPSSASLRLHERSDRELDALPFGVICLDREGLIHRYNLAEARFARLDRAQVLGRNFFEEVGVCTATPEFQGRVREMFDSRDQDPVRFDYIFHFRFGAQVVDIELLFASEPERVYVCVNRRKFGPLSDDVPREILAAAQSDLAPNESQQGVSRDTDGRRRVRVSPIVFEALAQTLEDGQWAEVCDEWGFGWGRLATVDVETHVITSLDSLLRELPMVTAMEAVSTYVGEEGWGRLSVDFGPARQGVMVVRLERNAFAEALGVSTTPRCHLWVGFLRAIFSHLAGRRVAVGEVSCCTQGFEACTFAVAGESRSAELAGALAAASGDLDRVIAKLGASR